MSALSSSAPSSSSLRQMMVDCQIRTFDVTDQKVLARMLDVPRENFIPAHLAALAYSDAALNVTPNGARVLLKPMILARLIQDAEISHTDRVLDIAGGLGYSAAVLAGLAGSVTALEENDELCSATTAACQKLGLTNVSVASGALAAGVPDKAPFDVILINGVVEDGLKNLLSQLAPHGRLVTLMSDGNMGRAVKAVRFDRYGMGEGASQRWLFNASGTHLHAFKRAPTFQF
jgi:protein-L-isoaspartate(D-aspartate) O-methyltransferase